MSIKIITDSTSDLERSAIETLGIDILPLTVRFGSDEYKDGVDITKKEFYTRLRKHKTLPTTSQVTPDAFESLFRQYTDEGHGVLVITIASKLSGTYQSANIAKNNVASGNIHIIDSETTTMGQALLVMLAVKARDEGKTLEEISRLITSLKKRVVLYAMIDSLEYLKKGGRLSTVGAAIGTLLNVKPMITVRDGVVDVAGKVRGTQKAYQWLVKQMDDKVPDPRYTIAFGHSDDEPAMEKLKAFAAKAHDITNHMDIAIGMTVGTHAGPGCVGVAYIAK